MDGQLSKTVKDKEVRGPILREIFGSERQLPKGGRIREQGTCTSHFYLYLVMFIHSRLLGMVDSVSPEEFDRKLDQKESSWEQKCPGFFGWFSRNTGKTIKESYLLPDRQALEGGLGGRVTNNDSEKLNGLIQQHFEYKRLPLQLMARELEKFVEGGYIVSFCIVHFIVFISFQQNSKDCRWLFAAEEISG